MTNTTELIDANSLQRIKYLAENAQRGTAVDQYDFRMVVTPEVVLRLLGEIKRLKEHGEHEATT